MFKEWVFPDRRGINAVFTISTEHETWFFIKFALTEVSFKLLAFSLYIGYWSCSNAEALESLTKEK